MLNKLWNCSPCKFIRAVVRHWGTLVTGGVAIGVLNIWQGTGHRVSHSLYWGVAIAALFVASFKAWNDERRAKEKSIADLANDRKQQAQRQQGAVLTHESWLELRRQKMLLEDELEALEHPETYDGIGSTLRSMRLSELLDWQKRHRRVRRIKEHLQLVNDRLQNVSQ